MKEENASCKRKQSGCDLFFFYKEIYEKNNDLEKVAQNAREDEKILSGELKKKIFTVPCVGKCIFCIFVRVFLMRSKNEKEKQKSFFF